MNGDYLPVLDNTWVSATSTYNYSMKDPLLDWLQYHYQKNFNQYHQYTGQINSQIPSSTKSFTSFLRNQGCEFESQIIDLLTQQFASARIANVNGSLSARDPKLAQLTLDYMKMGYPLIYSGVLHNHVDKTFGVPDLLVRSDWLKYLTKTTVLDQGEETIKAPNLESPWHYRVVDIKFSTLPLRADGKRILNSGAFRAYKSQLWVYNQALGQIQGYTPPKAYILGRKWRCTTKGKVLAGDYPFDRLGEIDFADVDSPIKELTDKSIAWIRDVKSEQAASWNITRYPLPREELYPNMCNTYDYPWHQVKEQLAKDSGELTQLWMVGPKNRKLALQAGVCRWTDPNCDAEVLGITGSKRAKILTEIIDINQQELDLIRPAYIGNNIGEWKNPRTIEFFVDFETCTSVVFNPGDPNASNIIFMIGVGYLDPQTGSWIHQDFSADRLDLQSEAAICARFSQFIRDKSSQYQVVNPSCIHWAHAEKTMWADAVARHQPHSARWGVVNWTWLDLLAVFKAEPIVVKGAMAFGLKEIAKAMSRHGLIETVWDPTGVCSDGQDAMLVAKDAHDYAIRNNVSMVGTPLMNNILKYNKVDVKVLFEIITYLRLNHTSLKRKSDTLQESSRPNKRRRVTEF